MIEKLRGMNDILGLKAEIYLHIVEICQKVARNFGYEFIQTPKLEQTQLFRRSVGESSDIVGKEMYEFKDKSQNYVCLRPEGTAGVVRAFIEHKFDRISKVQKYFYYGSMFRYERPQKGRLREFHQFGIECFGESCVYEDATVIIIAHKILQNLGIKTHLKLNSLGDSDDMNKYKKTLKTFLNANITHLCDDCKRRIATNPIRALDCKNENCQKILANAPEITQNLSKQANDDFTQLQRILKSQNIAFELDSKLVRGLDYYCKTTFEFISDEIGAQSAVLGGGRYDKLVEMLGGRETYAVGFAMGIERIMEILQNQAFKIKEFRIFICALDERFLDEIYTIANDLRSHFIVEISYTAKNPQKHLKTANSLKCAAFLCIGEDEFKNGEIWLKNLVNSSDKKIKITEISSELNKMKGEI